MTSDPSRTRLTDCLGPILYGLTAWARAAFRRVDRWLATPDLAERGEHTTV